MPHQNNFSAICVPEKYGLTGRQQQLERWSVDPIKLDNSELAERIVTPAQNSSDISVPTQPKPMILVRVQMNAIVRMN